MGGMTAMATLMLRKERPQMRAVAKPKARARPRE